MLDWTRISGHHQIPDAYLLALAVRCATSDHLLVP